MRMILIWALLFLFSENDSQQIEYWYRSERYHVVLGYHAKCLILLSCYLWYLWYL